jgi:hypothetical protein
MRALAAILLAMMVLAGPAAAAERRFDRDCMDDYARDLCQAETLSVIRAKFDVPAAEFLADQGFEGVRVFMIDGYSQDKPLISIFRTGDKAATLEVRALVAGRRLRVMSQPASTWSWELSQTLARLTVDSPLTTPSASMCLHAWVAVIEIIKDGRVTTRIRNACGQEDGMFEGAYALSPIALRALPGCREVDPKQYRNESAVIEGCAVLEGEHALEAASVLNQLNGRNFRDLGGLPKDRLERLFPVAEFQRVFHTKVVFSWPGESTTTGAAEAAALWRKLARDDDTYLSVLPLKIVADEAGIEVTGVIVSTASGSNPSDVRLEAPFSQEWRQDLDEGLKMTRWTVGPFVGVSRPQVQ